MNYKPSWKCRQEGERAYERNPHGANPYPEYGMNLDDSRHRRDWDDGFREAECREKERQAEEERQELAERQRKHDWEIERQRQEDEYWARKEEEEEREQEEQAPLCSP